MPITEIDLLVFSKDRAMQLDCMLRSMKRHCNIFNVTAIIKHTDEHFKRGYDYLKKKHTNVTFLDETDIIDDFKYGIWNGSSPYTCIITDDTIFYRSIDEEIGWRLLLSKVILACAAPDIFCMSLRLGVNTILQDYAKGTLQKPLGITEYEKMQGGMFIKWNWRKRPPLTNYGYPVGMDGHIFSKKLLQELTNWFEPQSLRDWEGRNCLEVHRPRFKSLPDYMIAPFKSIAVNVPANNVQVPKLPSGSKYPISVKELNELFLSGQEIDFEKMDFRNVRGAHQEIKLEFKSS